jgi:hypothetical protein
VLPSKEPIVPKYPASVPPVLIARLLPNALPLVLLIAKDDAAAAEVVSAD